MYDDRSLEPGVLRLAGAAAILSGALFLAGVGFQMSSGWFPEEHLQAGTMDLWLATVSAARGSALLGIGLSLAAISLWMFLAPPLYQMLRSESPAFSLLGLVGYLTGVPLALAAFGFALGATWGIVEASAPASVAEPLMRGFLVSDDFATFLIGGVGNGGFSIAAYRTRKLPRPICVLGIVASILVTVVLFRYAHPAFGLAGVGYPLIMFWFISVGVVLLRRAASPKEGGDVRTASAA